jgi:hypothetical protein
MSQTKAQLIDNLVQALNFTGTASAPANGLFLSATNTLQLSTASTPRLTINSDGHVDVVGNLDVGAGIDVTGNITATGTLACGDITSSDGNGNLTLKDNNHTGSNCEHLINFTASDDTSLMNIGTPFGSNNLFFKYGSTELVSIGTSGQVDFAGNVDCNAGLDVTGATTLTRGTDNATTAIINNAGTTGGNCLKLTSGGTGAGTSIFSVFRNNQSSEAEVFKIDGAGAITGTAGLSIAGKLYFGHSTTTFMFGSNNPKLQVTSATTNEWAGISSVSFTNDTTGGRLIIGKSKSGTVGTHGVLADNDQVGLITFEGSDGTNFHRAAHIQCLVDGSTGNDILPGEVEFGVTRTGASSPTSQMVISGSLTSVSLPNDTFLNIPHDERCIVFDEGQKMITSNDGQGNFNIIGGKNHDAVHVSSASGNSGIVQLELNSDGSAGSFIAAVGPVRAAGSSALFTNGISLAQSASGLDNFKYITGGSNTSPSGVGASGQEYIILHKGNCETGSWNTDTEAIFKVLGDGGSASLTTNDGGGNCNVCFNHASEEPDTNGSSWRITCPIDAANASFIVSSNGSVTSGQATGVTARLEITHTGTFVGSSTNNISDVRLKKNIATITDATTKIKGLIGRTFEWKDEAELDTGTQYGFIAQEMETVVSDLVSDGTSFGLRAFDTDGNLVSNVNHDGVKETIAEYSKGVNMTGVVPILVEALKEAIGKIETLETEVAALKAA